MEKRKDIRNVAIIAHVDHGKTTIVDKLLTQSGIFHKNKVVEDRVMDSGDIERERGITILSKNTAVSYKDIKINIIDTPGHADFGGEVERILKMVNGVILVVDAFEGPMPQTKFVLENALDLDLPVVVCINKTDRPEARPSEVADEVLELFMELEANDTQLDSPFVYASAKEGWASTDYDKKGEDISPILDAIVSHIPPPEGDPKAPAQVLISAIDYSDYLGRIGIGKIENGELNINDEAVILNMHDPNKKDIVKISKLYEFDGLERVDVNKSSFGSIVAISGIETIQIGDTLCHRENPVALPFTKISEPTITMNFSVNDSPFAGTEGDYVTTRQIKERLFKEINSDVSLRVEETDTTDSFRVSGRGELHLSILIETMRREGYEFQTSKPEVLYKYENDKKMEPIENAIIDVPEEFVGRIIEKLSERKGELENLQPSKGGFTRISITIPSRGLIGYRNEFLTDTKGYGIMNSVFKGYAPFKGEIPRRQQGSLVAFETGEATAYGLHGAQSRGELFIEPGEKVYHGMIVGRSPRAEDLDVNVCKKKAHSNVRAAGSDDSLGLSPPIKMSLEQAMEFIEVDELLEVTPKNLRMRKSILDQTKRLRARRK